MIDDFIAPPCLESIEILYQDPHILVINKPSGLLSLSGKHPLNKDSVHYRLVQDFPDALLVHRLDFGTSGIMLVAFGKDVVKELNCQFSNRQVTKQYEALLCGHLEQDHGHIHLPIAKGEFPLQKICFDSGKASHSEYKVIERMSDKTRVQFIPHTGRTHQLRIHSASLGHPIMGCDLYGADPTQTESERLMLHATQLSFRHPVTGDEMLINCPCPF